jgi:hypothetical protein
MRVASLIELNSADNFMKKLTLPLLIGLLVCAGCARHYTITMNNGNQIGARGRPKKKDGAYVFKDASGRQTSVSAGSVSEIAPASEVKDKKEPFKPSTMR